MKKKKVLIKNLLIAIGLGLLFWYASDVWALGVIVGIVYMIIAEKTFK